MVTTGKEEAGDERIEGLGNGRGRKGREGET